MLTAPDNGNCHHVLVAFIENLLELVQAGLAGIETYYPGYTPEINAELLTLADEFGLIPTGGTDYHGGNVTSVELGEVEVPWSTVERIQAWKASR